jgi:predicted P-loop ATPase
MEQWQRLDLHLLGIDDPIAAAFLPRYLISAVARVFRPGCYVRQTPVLIGKQERGKSELGRILFGAAHWVEGIGELGKDDLMKAHTAWGVELAELDGVTRRADQERLKAFLTEKTDTYRKPYDRAPEAHHRRFVFWGTSNGAPLEPEWHQKARLLRDADPEMDYLPLALKLQTDCGVMVTGKQVREVLEQDAKRRASGFAIPVQEVA